MINDDLVGGWATNPFWKMMEWVRQLGWLFHSQLFLESQKTIHGSSHHQPVMFITQLDDVRLIFMG